MSEKAKLIRSVGASMASTPADKEVLIGFDGFIDEIIHVVDTRQSVDEYTRIPTIAAFGRRISDAAGLSCNIEMVPEKIKLGGNGPIMANNLAMQGFGVRYAGALGADGRVHPVFSEFADSCKEIITVCDPGHTDALEFDDGKIMMGKMHTLPSVRWEAFLAQRDLAALQERIDAGSLVGCVNWTMLPRMNSVLEGLNGLFARRPSRGKLFIDLTDPRKRSREDVGEVLSILASLQSNVDVILGLNENESQQVAEVLGTPVTEGLPDRAQGIRTALQLAQVVIHPTKGAAVATEDGTWWIEGPYTPKPRLTTGAGDNFNAGYCNGLLSGLDPEGCLVSGVCSSGFYVRECRSASREELIAFMQGWAEVDGGELP